MIATLRQLFACTVIPLAALTPAHAESGLDAARNLFNRYVALEHAYDPAVADLYADEAIIKNRRVYPTGQVKEMTLPARAYKLLIRQTMPLAQSRGDRSTYSDVTYTQEGTRVRISAARFSELKQYTSPFTLLVGPSRDGDWLIYEELSHSQP